MRPRASSTTPTRAAALGLALLASPLGGCERREQNADKSAEAHGTATAAETGPLAGSVAEHAERDKLPEAPAPPPAPTCPEGMALLPGGAFWVGAEHESFEQEENPRFLTKLAPFCLDLTEVTVSAYEGCVEAGRCQPARTEYKTCNAGRADRQEHPINCIDYSQAESFCAWRGARLPSEIEWEYAARGGAEQRKYPWGDEPPDGRTCWKHHQSCPVQSFPAGAFGLYDVVGNVWEWTSDWFGPYPWPLENGRHRVYRGGSWSRRFEKWMRATLRNRYGPEHWGSHLGARCALSPEPLSCPYGRDEGAAQCRRGVEEARCLDGKHWNGARCAAKGAPLCPEGAKLVAGRGCVGAAAVSSGQRDSVGRSSQESEISAVKKLRAPEFDADCAANQPARPSAYRFEGGSHAGRNQAGRRDGCKNRDVGVGWNSACCP